jgi:hypothetical protein
VIWMPLQYPAPKLPASLYWNLAII